MADDNLIDKKNTLRGDKQRLEARIAHLNTLNDGVTRGCEEAQCRFEAELEGLRRKGKQILQERCNCEEAIREIDEELAALP